MGGFPPGRKSEDEPESESEAERRRLLIIVTEKGLKSLNIAELERLHTLLEIKDYGDNKRAARSKKKLLKQINFAIYDLVQQR